MLLDNKYILIGKEPFIWTTWRDAGIHYINDILHNNQPRFLSNTELAEKYGIDASFLHILQIRAAIPCAWQRKIISPADNKIDGSPRIMSMEEQGSVKVIGKTSKFLYSNVIKSLKPRVTSQLRWSEMFPRDDNEKEEYWAAVYRNPYKSVRDTKLQAFHYRVVHRFLPCNKFLQNIRIRRDVICSFCAGSDSIEHFLSLCPIVKSFWKDVWEWFAREVDVQLNIPLRAFLFGVPDQIPHATMINFLILFIKHYIYRQKVFHQGSLSLVQVLKELRRRLQVEEYITMLLIPTEHRSEATNADTD